MSGPESLLIYLLLGSFAGFMAGLLGVGGGGVLVPLLATIFTYQGWPTENVVHFALGTAMTAMIISSLSSTTAHASKGNVEWMAVKGMATGIILGAFITTRIASNLSSFYIAVFFAAFMALISAQMFLNWSPTPSNSKPTTISLFLVGLGVGSISALAAVGGGFLTIAYLSYKNVGIKRAIGTSAAIGLPIAIAGSIGYIINGWTYTSGHPYTLGFVYVPAFVAIAVSSFFAAPYGARLSLKLPNVHLKKIFALVTLALSAKMLINIA